ncbi:MAG TPA: 4-hydroxy-tetrahydrodipicolinate synthase, partial [Burkholderiaceae bacterium]|nr:4-hydroxy-tetrahydrodipicolinate synthase [Burkholderiaceae bacterium]
MFTGSIVAIVTPMFEDGSIDWDSYRNLIDWHVAEGTSAIVAVGTTGESPTVSVEEHCELIKFAVEAAGKRIPVIAGSGGNSTREAIELTAYAKSVGADASLSVVPYYNKPTQEGLYQHFKAIAEKVDLPILLYDVPGRSVVSLAVDTTVRLSKVPGIVGIKDATGDLVKHVELTMRLPDNFSLLSGNDDTALGYVLLGGHGV